MAQFKVALIVGSNRRESVNRKLAQALAKLGAPGLQFQFVQIDDLPLYNQDNESNLPAGVVRFKSEIAAADGIVFVTPEHSRSIPAVLKTPSIGARGRGARTPGPASSPPSPAPRRARSVPHWRSSTSARSSARRAFC